MDKEMYVVMGGAFIDFDIPTIEAAWNSELYGIFDNYDEALSYFKKLVIKTYHDYLDGNIYDLHFSDDELFIDHYGDAPKDALVTINYSEYKNGEKSWVAYDNSDETNPIAIMVYPRVYLKIIKGLSISVD